MATSANGIIARNNNEEDFLSHTNWDTLVELTTKTGCLIWGRKTYEIVKKWDKKYLDTLKNIVKVIISSDQSFEVEEGFVKVNSPKKALEILEKKGFTSAILTGGSHNNTSFAKENLINEIILNIEPVVIGMGILVFASDDFDLKLELLETKEINKNLLQLHYKVIKNV